MMRFRSSILILGLALCSAAQAQPAPDTVSMKYSASDSGEAPPVQLRGACGVAVRTVSDQRPNKETIGADFKPLLSRDGAPWMGDALRNLKAYGFTVRDGAGGAGDIVVDASLIRAYTWNISMRINAMVALNVEYQSPEGTKSTAKYRAYGSKTNMWGAADEFMTTLNYAMNNVLAKMAADLQKRCAGG